MTISEAERLFEAGNAHAEAGEFALAAAAFGECAALEPGHAGALRNQGNAFLAGGDLTAAIAAYQEYLLLAPSDIDARFTLGTTLTQADRLIEAVGVYIMCVRQAPDFGAAYVNLAGALRGLGVLDHALQMAVTAVHLMPHNVDSLACLAGLYFDLGQFDDAVEFYGRALAISPTHAGVLSSLANALHAAGSIEAALHLHDRAYAIEPGNADYRYNRALCMLAAGDFKRGWAEHEWRLQRARALRTRPDRGVQWQGEDIAGRTILLHAEQGLGDTLQFIRYVPMVVELGARVILAVPPPLVRFATTMLAAHRDLIVLTEQSAAPPYDLHCPLMSLPYCFGTLWETIPAPIPYFDIAVAAAAFGEQGRRSLATTGGGRLLVGVVWAGGAHRDEVESMLIDRRRSIPAPALAPLAAVTGVCFVSLQKDVDALPDCLDLHDPMAEVVDFLDTAAIIADLDLVIAVDTAVAHLAGALGKPVWLLSRFDGCWRWRDRQIDTPWYPTMRIFRQGRESDWGAVVTDVAGELQKLAHHHRQSVVGMSESHGRMEQGAQTACLL